ncbi:hypothetical protein BAE46_03210 [Glaciecola punicea]|uniref:secretin N-terminal domain-containing protein n=1 Tax=Glaciecola punicea TaxID=56804 RepID=UPI000871F4FE|nr:secretin N-terminal domain-containing protein [Glaciecola punicea]OFA32776.1 hypothetical protein BAE46_03210 [Glaciecola punicea]
MKVVLPTIKLQRVIKAAAVISVLAALAGCAQTPRQYTVDPSRMASDERFDNQQSDVGTTTPLERAEAGIKRLTPLVLEERELQQHENAAQFFSDNDQQQVSADELAVSDFVQTILGDVLAVNYIITDEARRVGGSVTLNVAEPVSSRRLFVLASELLDERGLSLTRRDNVFYVTQKENNSRGGAIIGRGRERADVPDTVLPVLQIIPLRYGITLSIERTLRSLSSAVITPDFDQNALFVQGPRNEVLRVIDLVNLLDVRAHRGKFVGLLQLTYITTKEFTEKASQLLAAEGIRASTSASGGNALLMVPIDQVGAVALFAGEDFILQRVEYWAKQIDRPTQGAEKRYYIYHPQYARASDLGASIAPLLSGDAGANANQSRDTQSAQGGQQLVAGSQPRSGQGNNQGPQVVNVVSEDLRMTVDERSNSIIFFTSGQTYASLLPIIQRLDIMPKQILLDATIAEVTLTDEFALGFEFAFRSGRLTGGTLGRLGLPGGGVGLNWSDGIGDILASLSASTNLVNVLSNPTLVVRDGVSANISVGNDIPTVGATVSDPIQGDRQTTVVNYRKTGVDLTVTPTINARGLVILKIEQQISNESEGGSNIAGSPSIFERSIRTEVLAQSGQTVLLGGLISENTTNNNARVPGLASLPLVGHLFKSRSESKVKTELVIFITPRVIERADQWTEIRARISEGLINLKIAE